MEANSRDNETSRLLHRLAGGDEKVESELYERVYADLHERADAIMRHQPAGHTLQATALLHEAWFRLADLDLHGVRSKSHFLRLAVRAMRCVLIDHARARMADKRGGGVVRISLDDVDPVVPQQDEALLVLHDALTRLQQVDADLARVAELRLFGGLEHREIAEAVGVSTRTIERAWQSALAWLQRELGSAAAAGSDSGGT